MFSFIKGDCSEFPVWFVHSLFCSDTGESILKESLYDKKLVNIMELPHDKTNKNDVCPAKTRISLGIRPV